jgi:hypothetical protein
MVTHIKMIKKYRFRLILIALLGLLAVFLHEYRQRAALGHRDVIFAVKDSDKVNEILISGNDSRAVLRKSNDGWILSSEHAVREKAVEILLQTLERIRISGPVPLSQRDAIREKLMNESVRIGIREGRKLKTYLVYSAGRHEPTYMQMPGDSRIFMTEIVGFSGNIASVFIPDENYWRTNILFNYQADEITEVIVSHKDNNGDSFILRQSPVNKFSLYSYPENKQSEGLNDSMVIRYLANFFYTPYERVANADERLLSDSLFNAQPDHLIKVTSKQGKVSEVRFHKIITDAGRKSESLQFDLFRLHAITDDGSMIIIPYHSVDLLLRSSSYFFPGKS